MKCKNLILCASSAVMAIFYSRQMLWKYHVIYQNKRLSFLYVHIQTWIKELTLSHSFSHCRTSATSPACRSPSQVLEWTLKHPEESRGVIYLKSIKTAKKNILVFEPVIFWSSLIYNTVLQLEQVRSTKQFRSVKASFNVQVHLKKLEYGES